VAGLVAIVANDRRSVVRAGELDEMVRDYKALRGPGEVRYVAAGTWARVACVYGSVAGQFRSNGNGGWLLAVGDVYSSRPLLEAARQELDGIFALIRYGSQPDELEIMNDPLGMQSLYMATANGRSYISTSSTLLGRHLARDLEPVAARLFLAAGSQFGPLTHFRGVERLEPATALVFGPHRYGRDTYWAPEVDERVRQMSLRQTADHCIDIAVATIKARLTAEPCLSADLTGGYDSRLVAVLFREAGLDFTTHTNGNGVDVRLAEQVALKGQFLWHHERLPARWTLGSQEVQRAATWADGTLEVLQLAEVLSYQEHRSASCGVVVSGGGGEHFGPYPWMQEFLRAGHSRQVNMDNLLSMRVLPRMNLSVLRSDDMSDVRDYCRDVFARRVRGYQGELNTTQLDVIYAYKSVGHFGAYRCASEAWIRSVLPCYYRDIFSAAFSAHYRWRRNHRLHRAIIERVNPAVAAVETERGGPAALLRPGNAYRFLPYYGRLAGTALRKLSNRSRGTTALPPSTTAAYRGALHRLRASGVLDSRYMHTADLYDKHGLGALLDSIERPGFAAWGLVGRVATIELVARAVAAQSVGP
jgi:hypothetical protein